MAGEPKLDIIDEAMKADDTDYGDKPEIAGDETTVEGGAEDTGTNLPTDQRGNAPDDTAGQRTSGVPQVPQGGPQPQLTKVGAQFADGKGNIVDKDGKVIARAGVEARFWQEASRATAQVRNLTTENAKLTRDLQSSKQVIDQARQIAEMPSKLGMNKDEFNEGMTIMSKWKSDPVGVAKEVVARAMSLGHNLTDIVGNSVGNAVEMTALRSLVNEATAPLKQQQDAAARTTQATTKATEAYQSFVESHPHAELHGEAIANLMERGATAERAYYEIKIFATEHGLDFEQPLGPQIAALVADQRNTGQQQQQPSGQQNRPMVNGNGRGSNDVQTQVAQASPDSSWGDILNDVMRTTQ